MLFSKHPLTRADTAAAPRIAQRAHACGQIVQAEQRVGMLFAEHALSAVERTPEEERRPGRVTAALQKVACPIQQSSGSIGSAVGNRVRQEQLLMRQQQPAQQPLAGSS
jgi:hypothetical protein